MSSSIINSDSGITFSGPDATAIYRACVIRQGLRLYAATGMKPNRMYTPTAMLAAAGQITGRVYKRGKYAEAIAELDEWIDRARGYVEVIDERTS